MACCPGCAAGAKRCPEMIEEPQPVQAWFKEDRAPRLPARGMTLLEAEVEARVRDEGVQFDGIMKVT